MLRSEAWVERVWGAAKARSVCAPVGLSRLPGGLVARCGRVVAAGGLLAERPVAGGRKSAGRIPFDEKKPELLFPTDRDSVANARLPAHLGTPAAVSSRDSGDHRLKASDGHHCPRRIRYHGAGVRAS